MGFELTYIKTQISEIPTGWNIMEMSPNVQSPNYLFDAFFLSKNNILIGLAHKENLTLGKKGIEGTIIDLSENKQNIGLLKNLLKMAPEMFVVEDELVFTRDYFARLIQRGLRYNNKKIRTNSFYQRSPKQGLAHLFGFQTPRLPAKIIS